MEKYYKLQVTRNEINETVMIMVGDSVISGFLSPTEEPYYHCEGFSSFRASQLYFCQDDLSGKEKTLPNGLTFIATPSNQDEFEAMKALSLLTGQE